MNNIEIRKFNAKDIKNILNMQRTWADENITYGYTPYTEKECFDRLSDYSLVAEIEGEIVGFVFGSVHESNNMAIIPTGRLYLEIDDIYVAKTYRNKGIGSILLNRIIQVAHDYAIENFLLYSANKNIEQILKFYKSHGFKSWCVRMYK